MADGGRTSGPDGQPSVAPGRAVEGELVRVLQELEDNTTEVVTAAREWGVRPDHLEGRFVTSLLNTLRSLGRLTQAAASDSTAMARSVRVVAETELEALRVSNRMAATVLDQAKVALAGSEVQHDKAITKFVDVISPKVVTAIREAVVIRERQHNQKVQWRRAFGIAALGGGLLLGGFVWGSWTPSVSTVEGAIAAERIKRCQAAPIKDTRTSETYCPMSVLMAPL